MSQSKKLIPRRRFKECENSQIWKQSYFLQVIINIIDFRGRTPKKLGMDWSECGFLALSALNVKNGYIDFSADAHYGDNNLYLKWMGGNELRKGQVIFTTEAPMGNVAQIPDDNGYILSQRTIAFEVNKSEITDDFLAILLKSPSVYNSLLMMTSGGTAKGVSQKSLSTLKINLPSSITEQTQIGEFFKKLDHLINTQQKKLEKAKTLKSAYLTEMFPNEGELKPKLRFSGFIENWKSDRLGNLVIWNKGTNLAKSVLNSESNGHPVIHYADLYKFYPVIDEVIHWSESDEGNLIPENSLLFPMSDVTPKGLARTTTITKKNVKAGSDTLIATLSDKINAEYLSYQINANYKKIFPLVTGTTVKHISANSLSTLTIEYTNRMEQKKIAKFFRTLEIKLNLEQKKLNKLKNIKQAYLNEMFV
ncbi:hypothetical protein BHC46_06365 [Snodgrassella alvi]|uniref:Type I restriction modification DNA specificity domain-containing protein n=1 Tax=Snodgrassella alvi TaxID=1196083 RepID=A0A2N9XHU0_9NEIS|nr:restriction endonuclease subunit S [Snodgrassella alvi]PIT47895.1 hypothetical protein BHC46_06365 [Snodgrassella alvi]